MKEHPIEFKNEEIFIKRAEMWYYACLCEYELNGLKFFDQHGNLLLQVGECLNRMSELIL